MQTFLDFWNLIKAKKISPTQFHTYKNEIWTSVNLSEFVVRVENLAAYLNSKHRIQNRRAAILSENSMQWDIAQFAVLINGGAVVGISTQESFGNINAIYNTAPFDILFLDSKERLKSIPEAVLGKLRAVYFLNELNGLTSFAPYRAPQMNPTDIALIIFTSGTTHMPKGLVYSHGQLVLAIQAMAEHFSFGREARSLAWLPMHNPFQRMTNLISIYSDGSIYYWTDPKNVMQAIQQVKPQFFQSVPRFYEKIYEQLQHQIQTWPIRMFYALRFKSLINYWIRKKVFGGQMKYLLSGSALFHSHLARFYQDLGFKIINAYGTSECLIPLCASSLEKCSMGEVGRPLPHIELKVSQQGEVLIQGPTLGQWIQNDQVQPLPLDNEGYYHTGDLAEWNEVSEIVLKGRIGNSFKTSTGKKIYPEVIEQELRKIAGIEHAVVYGEGQKYLSVILDLNPKVWNIRDSRIITDLETCFQALDLPRDHVPAEIILSPSPFTVETGELTMNLKLRRNHIIEKLGFAECSGQVKYAE